MSVQPVILSFRGRPDPSAQQLRAASRIAANAALCFERMTGYYPRAKTAIALRDATRALGSNRNVSERPSFFAMASMALGEAGFDTSEGLYLVYLMQGRPAGSALDNSGLGNPTWTVAMYGSGQWGWQERANPDAGGVALIGQGGLDLVPPSESPTGLRYGRSRRFSYFRALLTAVHELGHAMGVPHSGFDQAQHPDPQGDPWNPAHQQASVMAYGYGSARPSWPWPNGLMRSVGFHVDELATLRRSVHMVPSRSEYTRVFVADREKIAGGSQDVRQALMPGFLLEEYGPLSF